MFGRRKRDEAAAAEAAREAERRALFEKLAQRPENICPFLGLADDRAGYVEGVSDEHRCFAFGDPALLSAEQQTRVCQERGYGNCPRYLRGVLVIPTEELEALRRPRPAATEAAPPPPPPVRTERRRKSALPMVLGGVVLIAAVGAGAFFLLNRDDGVAVASPTPTPTFTPPPATPSPSVAPSTEPTAEPTPLPTPPPVAWQWVECEPELPCAEDLVVRDEMANFLSRAFELDPVLDQDAFTDIAGNQYRGSINAVAVAGLTVGCEETLYCPDGQVTREQMASFIQRAFDLPPSDTDFFTDDDDSIHENAINAVAAAGVADACEGTSFCPRDVVTRGEMAGYLHRALNYPS